MITDGLAIKHPDQLWIGGAWVPPRSGRMIDLVSPDTETVVAQVADA